MKYLLVIVMLAFISSAIGQTKYALLNEMIKAFKKYDIQTETSGYLDKDNLIRVTFMRKNDKSILVRFIIIPTSLVDSPFVKKIKDFNLKQSCSHISDGDAIDFKSFSYQGDTFVLYPCNICSGFFDPACKEFKSDLSSFLKKKKVAFLLL
jgi:hypothetical protein